MTIDLAWIDALDALPRPACHEALLRCCGSVAWVEAMLEARPFSSAERLHARADEAWSSVSREDWLLAFAAHPRIGSRADVAKKSGTERAWSSSEQAGVDGALDDVKAALARANEAYEARFGFIFLICATGKSAGEMLAACVERLTHERDDEIAIAAEEQRKILHLRLDKWLGEFAAPTTGASR